MSNNNRYVHLVRMIIMYLMISNRRYVLFAKGAPLSPPSLIIIIIIHRDWLMIREGGGTTEEEVPIISYDSLPGG
jgi:hypothetical protein